MSYVQHKKWIIVVLFLSLVLIAGTKREKPFTPYAPPGTIETPFGFYLDEHEVTSRDFLEFIYYNGRVFPKEIWTQYPDIFPSQAGKSYKDVLDSMYQIAYLFHPKYAYYPVVNISKKDIELYSSWRTNMVFISQLLHLKRLNKKSQIAQEILLGKFSVAAYMKGNYKGITPDTNLLIPVYSLPSFSEYYAVWELEKDTAPLYSYFITQKPSYYLMEASQFNLGVSPIKVLSTKKSPLGFYDLLGNANEVCSDDSLFGGSFRTPANEVFLYPNTHYTGPNWETGFRSKCRFMTWSQYQQFLKEYPEYALYDQLLHSFSE